MILQTAGATAALVLVLYLWFRIQGRAIRFLDARRGTRIREWRIQETVLLTEEHLLRLLHGVIRIAFLLATVPAFLAYANFVLSRFPETADVASWIGDLFRDAARTVGQGLLGYLPNLAIVIVVAILTRIVLALSGKVFTGIREERIRIRGFYAEWAPPTRNLVRVGVLAMALVAVFPYLPGSEAPAFRSVSIFLGVILSIGSSAAMGNIVAGIFLTYARSFRLGEWVEIAGVTGAVIEKGLLSTRIRTHKHREVSLPNSIVLGAQVVNLSASARDRGLVLHTTVTLGYDVSWRRAHELMIESALAVEGVESEPAPFVLQTSLNDFHVSYELNAVTRVPEVMPRLYSDIHRNMQDRFAEAGIEILSPAYEAQRDGTGPVLPKPAPRA